ncbi:MAG: PhnD/SsuA/transferrin family substrate-binding protein, partial [Gammaproteobacteria bacterium]|nr:PhnD/SsuA/transferrin family substrate-binding protein [Gammaproteobacteria bacterium]
MLIFSSAANAQTVKIGVRAINGIDNTIAKWQKTADYLTQSIKGTTFELIPVTSIDDLSNRTGNNEFDFILTIPSSYVDIEQKYNASRLLTLQNKRQGKPYTVFGSVIFTHKNRSDINTIADLENKTLMVISKKAFGGWRVAWGEMLNNSFDPHKKLKKLIYSSKNTQFDVVESVIRGDVDAGVVRTDMLERMHAKNKIDIKNIKVIGQKTTKGFPFLHSTKLYPEWAFVKSHNTPNELAQEVAIALLQLEKNHPAAISGQYVGWNVPLNYEPVNELLRQLRVEPYQNYGRLNLTQALNVYRLEIATIIGILLFTIGTLLYFFRTNRLLNQKRRGIQNELNALEIEIDQRNNNISLLNTIGNAQSYYINNNNERLAFDTLLTGILELTDSYFGAIVQLTENNNPLHCYIPYSIIVRYLEEDGQLSTRTIPVNLSRVNPVYELFEDVKNTKRTKTKTIDLRDQNIFSQKTLANIPGSSNAAGIPITSGKHLIGIIFLWNSPKQYNPKTLDLISPLFSTCTNLITRFNESKISKENEDARREAEQQQRTILESMSDALIIINDEGNIIQFNQAAESIFGYTSAEIIGNSSGILMPEKLTSKHNDSVK